MKINAFADVSLRALMVLAAAPGGTLLTTQNIADAVGTPYNHVSKAMAKLRTLGLIDVERGRSGGSRLSSAGRRATVGQVLRDLDTRTDAADCVTPGGDCPLIRECKLRAALGGIDIAPVKLFTGNLMQWLWPNFPARGRWHPSSR